MVKRYNVCLIGIGKDKQKQSVISEISCEIKNSLTQNILLNPGSNYFIEPNDTCFYISLVKEENYDWKNFKFRPCNYNLIFNNKTKLI